MDVTNSTKLFADSARWEPGHTEVAYLHIKNAGSLDLKYKLNVNIYDEKGSTNVNGDFFKLSDYLKFDLIEMTDPSGFYEKTDAGRNQAREDAKNPKSLSAWTTGANLYAAPTEGEQVGEQYFALVIYMPESVGNEANYKTAEDVEPPYIEMGVTVVATQLNSESDSFGPDYDVDADGTPDNGAAWTMPAFQATVVAPEDVGTNGMTIIKYQDESAADKVKLAQVTIPAGAVSTGDKVTLSVKPAPVPGTVTPAPNQTAFNYDITLVKGSNDAVATTDYPVTVELNIGKNLSGPKIFHTHDGTTNEVTGVVYNAETGIASFTTTSFSDYTVVYKTVAEPVATVTFANGEVEKYFASKTYKVAPETGYDAANWSKEYQALSRAFYDVAKNGGTIVIDQDLVFGENDAFGLDLIGDYTMTQVGNRRVFKKVATVKNVILDLNGHSLTFNYNKEKAKRNSLICLANVNATIKDSSPEKSGKIFSHFLSDISHWGNDVVRVEAGAFLTDCVSRCLWYRYLEEHGSCL